jgi:hypothetical protein
VNSASGRLVAGFGLVAVLAVGASVADRSAAVSSADAPALAAGSPDASSSAVWPGIPASRSALYENVLDARPGFVEALGAVVAAIDSAAGKVDTTDARALVSALEASVFGESANPSVVIAAEERLAGLAEEIRARVEAFDAEQARVAQARAAEARAAATRAAAARAPSAGPATASVPTAKTAGGASRVRAALDRVGGAGVPLKRYNGSCGGVKAPACAFSTGTIAYTSAVTTWSTSRIRWAMAHELAHLRQFAVWRALNAAPGYRSLFGKNPERLANCMARQRGYPGSTASCSKAQLAWAASIWRGVVPG